MSARYFSNFWLRKQRRLESTKVMKTYFLWRRTEKSLPGGTFREFSRKKAGMTETRIKFHISVAASNVRQQERSFFTPGAWVSHTLGGLERKGLGKWQAEQITTNRSRYRQMHLTGSRKFLTAPTGKIHILQRPCEEPRRHWVHFFQASEGLP